MHLSMMAAQIKSYTERSPETWHQDKLAAFGTLKYSLFKKALQQQFRCAENGLICSNTFNASLWIKLSIEAKSNGFWQCIT
jgi:hypothetical protein